MCHCAPGAGHATARARSLTRCSRCALAALVRCSRCALDTSRFALAALALRARGPRASRSQPSRFALELKTIVVRKRFRTDGRTDGRTINGGACLHPAKHFIVSCCQNILYISIWLLKPIGFFIECSPWFPLTCTTHCYHSGSLLEQPPLLKQLEIAFLK